MKKLRHSQNNGIRLCLDLVLLSFSYFVSLTIVNLWYPINFSRFFLSGLLIVVFSKLSIILITLFYYLRKDKFVGVLLIVSVYNLVSFCSLYLMNFDKVIEVGAVNLIVDIFLIGTSRLIQINSNARDTYQKMTKLRDNSLVMRQDSSPAVHSNEALDNEEIMLLSMLKLINHKSKKLNENFNYSAPLIIGKGLSGDANEKLKFMLPKCSVFNVSYKGMGKPIVCLKKFAEINSFDSIIVCKENFYRLEFLDIMEIIKDYPYHIEILDKNYELHSMKYIEDILRMFPLNIQHKKQYSGHYLLLYTGDWCDELAMRLLEGDADSVTILETDLRIQEKHSKISGLHFINSLEESKNLKNCDHIIYGLPITDIIKGQKLAHNAISTNMSVTGVVLDIALNIKPKTFTFISSTVIQNQVSTISISYKRVEQMVRALERKHSTKFQAIRMPNYISNDNNFLKELKKNPNNKVIEVAPEDALVYLYSKEEAIVLLLSLMELGQSSIAYMGEQVFLPEIYNNLNFNGILEDEVKVIFKEKSYPMNFYLEENEDFTKYQRSSSVYGYYMGEEGLDRAGENTL